MVELAQLSHRSSGHRSSQGKFRRRRDFEALSLRGCAAAAAYRAAELRGDPHPERATSWFAEQEIAEPAKWTRIYAP